MKKNIFIITFLWLISANMLALAYDDGDFQVWHNESQELKITDFFKVNIEEEVRFADQAAYLNYQHYEVGYAYTLNKYISLGANYRQTYDKKSREAQFQEENMPNVVAWLKYDLYGFSLENRNRLEYRHFYYQPDSWRYRNKWTIKFPWKFTPLKIQPYLADEIFIDCRLGELNQNRFFSGFAFNIYKNIKGEIYYLFRFAKSAPIWKDSNVLGTKIKIIF